MNISVRICNTRKRYLLALVVIIVMGLLSRRVMWLPNSTGDMFWAMMMFCFVRLIFIHWHLRMAAVITLCISFSVEFSQLIRWDWLCQFRNTFVGHMMLGQGFMWQDLVAYLIGVGLMLGLEIITSK